MKKWGILRAIISLMLLAQNAYSFSIRQEALNLAQDILGENASQKKEKFFEMKRLFEESFAQGNRDTFFDIYFFTAGIFLDDASYLQSLFLNDATPGLSSDLAKFINDGVAGKLAYALKANRYREQVKIEFLVKNLKSVKKCQIFINGKKFEEIESVSIPAGIKAYIGFYCENGEFYVNRSVLGQNQTLLRIPLVIK